MDAPRFSYADHFLENLGSARKIVPVVLDLIEKPQSVVDVGGGTGSWCKVFKDCGVTRVTCMDDPRIGREQLLVAQNEFVGCDLGEALPSPVPVDLAVCMEVVEHLPAARGEPTVEFLTRCADLILFSAAIPGQPEVRHINEQAPDYWKGLFERRGYRQLDIIRPRIIADTTISYWYRQNLFLYASERGLPRVRTQQVPYASIPGDFELVYRKVMATYRALPPGPTGRQALKDLGRTILRRLQGGFR